MGRRARCKATKDNGERLERTINTLDHATAALACKVGERGRNGVEHGVLYARLD